jgi:ubiquinol-cytochrome c reductase cytochrome c1 subunit
MVAKHFLLLAAATICLSVPAMAQSKPIILKGGTEEVVPVAEESVTEGEVATSQADETSGGADTSSTDVHHTAESAAVDHAPGDEASGAASHGAHEIAKQKWSFNGIFGTYDRAALQRGFQVYKEVCAACHSMSRLAYRNLEDLGYSEAEIKAIAADATINDGPNDEGEMFDRPGRPSDAFKAPYPNVQAAKSVNNGAYPPDLSLISKSRYGGADYIYAILTGYEEPPANRELMPGQSWNKAMTGNVIAMPAPLSAGQVIYGDGADQSVDQYARDVAQFLTWASEPKMEVRKRTGVKVFLFLLVFTAVMYAVKRKIWADLH